MLRLTTALLDRTIHPEEPGDLRGLTREFALRQFGVNYRKSPIVVDDSVKDDDAETYDPYRSGDNGEVRAGDRAPDAEIGGGGEHKTVYDLFGATYHTVLVFAPDFSAARGVLEYVRGLDGALFRPVLVLPQVEKEDREDIVKDAGGHVYENYRVKEGEVVVVVVRPDSWIGARVGGVAGIEQYLQALSIHA